MALSACTAVVGSLIAAVHNGEHIALGERVPGAEVELDLDTGPLRLLRERLAVDHPQSPSRFGQATDRLVVRGSRSWMPASAGPVEPR